MLRSGTRPEVTDAEGGSTVCNDLFDTHQAAYAEFVMALEREGLSCFLEATAHAHWHR
jgi:hypothetical protein